MLIIGILCFIIPGIIWGLFLLAFRLRSKEAIGTIVDTHTGQGELGQISAPIVEFQLPDGKKVTFTEKTHSNETIFDMIGSIFSKFVLKKDLNQVRVLYDPNNPEKARVNSFNYLYFMPVSLLLIGFCIILYAIPMFHDILAPILYFIDRLTKYL